MAERRACGICGQLTGFADGFCRSSARCAAARQRAFYNRVKGPFPSCLACGLPLRKRYGRVHTECHTHPRRILLARLMADLEQLEARREQAQRAAYAARKKAERERRLAAPTGAAAAQQLHARERWLAQTRAGKPCPTCGAVLGPSGFCARSAGCIDSGMSLIMPSYNPARLYRVA